MATWIVGDIHGCAVELAELVERLGMGSEDRLVSVGDLFHRGPDPVGVMEILQELDAPFVLGNHELAVLRRVGLAPAGVDPSDRPARRAEFPTLDEDDLAGDGGMPCVVAPERRADVLRFLQDHAGFYLRNSDVPCAGPTDDGRGWCVVHAGRLPGVPLEECEPMQLTRSRRLPMRHRPYWYEVWEGPELVLFGHTPSPIPRMQRVGGRLVALGLDTGCVYGGKLTAYSPELDDFKSVKARAAYARE